MENRTFKLGIVVSHPIQHFCPQYVSFSNIPGVKVKTFFASALGFMKYFDTNFGKEISWGNLKMDDFDHVFLNGEEILPSDKNLDAPSLEAELKTFNPDAIISYGYFQKVQRRVHKWANRNKVPIVYITDAENRQKRLIWKRLAKLFFLRYYLKRIDYFFTVGNANETYYKLYGVNSAKFIRMHYPIDIDVYSNAFLNREILRKKVREEYRISNDEFVISVVGKLVEWKNQVHLIDLLENLEKNKKRAHVFILGSGEMMHTIKKRAEVLRDNKVYFVGFVDPLELPKYYAASDLYLHPARIEPHSLALSEAIYMGCPIVISDRCGSYGISDDVQEGKNGFVYKFGDIKDMSSKVELLINNEDLRISFSSRSIEISRQFQKRAHGQCLIDLIKHIRN